MVVSIHNTVNVVNAIVLIIFIVVVMVMIMIVVIVVRAPIVGHTVAWNPHGTESFSDESVQQQERQQPQPRQRAARCQ